MSDRSPSLIAIEAATILVMSDEALGIDDGHVVGTMVGTLQGNPTVPNLNASRPQVYRRWKAPLSAANLSPLVSAPTLNVNQECHMLYQQYIQVGETADQARAAVSQTEAEAEQRHRAYAVRAMESPVKAEADEPIDIVMDTRSSSAEATVDEPQLPPLASAPEGTLVIADEVPPIEVTVKATAEEEKDAADTSMPSVAERPTVDDGTLITPSGSTTTASYIINTTATHVVNDVEGVPAETHPQRRPRGSAPPDQTPPEYWPSSL